MVAVEVFYPRAVSHGNPSIALRAGPLIAKEAVFGHGAAGLFIIVAEVHGCDAVFGFQQAFPVAVVGETDAVTGPGDTCQFVFGVEGLGVNCAAYGAGEHIPVLVVAKTAQPGDAGHGVGPGGQRIRSPHQL